MAHIPAKWPGSSTGGKSAAAFMDGELTCPAVANIPSGKVAAGIPLHSARRASRFPASSKCTPPPMVRTRGPAPGPVCFPPKAIEVHRTHHHQRPRRNLWVRTYNPRRPPLLSPPTGARRRCSTIPSRRFFRTARAPPLASTSTFSHLVHFRKYTGHCVKGFGPACFTVPAFVAKLACAVDVDPASVFAHKLAVFVQRLRNTLAAKARHKRHPARVVGFPRFGPFDLQDPAIRSGRPKGRACADAAPWPTSAADSHCFARHRRCSVIASALLPSGAVPGFAW